MKGAPNFLHRGPSCSMRPGSPLMEFTSGEPGCVHRAFSMASMSEVSSDSGNSKRELKARARAGSTVFSSTMGAPTFTSSTPAPWAACSVARRRAAAWKFWESSSARAFLPVGLMRSPMMTSGFSPPKATEDDRQVSTSGEGSGGTGLRQGRSATAARKAEMCAGVVPQQPPRNLAPISAKARHCRAKSSGPRRNTVRPSSSSSGRPALGCTRSDVESLGSMARTTSTICSGPAEQLVPRKSTPRFCMVSMKVSGDVPVRDLAPSKVMVTPTGRSRESCSETSRAAMTMALASARSNCVSPRMRSAPPSARPRICSR